MVFFLFEYLERTSRTIYSILLIQNIDEKTFQPEFNLSTLSETRATGNFLTRFYKLRWKFGNLKPKYTSAARTDKLSGRFLKEIESILADSSYKTLYYLDQVIQEWTE